MNNCRQYKMSWFFLSIILGASVLVTSCRSEEEQRQKELEAAEKAGYTRGYNEGYHAAKAENDATYQQGYENARREIARKTATTYGIAGLVIGLIAGLGGSLTVARKTILARVHDVRKTYELRKAFEHIPAGLPPDVYDMADRIAHAYANILEQLRSSTGYIVSQYSERWRPRLKDFMQKATQLMELIQELETARKNVDEERLQQSIHELQQTVRQSRDDEARHAAMKSLNRAKQTRQDLARTTRNLELCKTSLQGIIGVLESMHLKISNLKVNTQRADLLEELSSDIETEMSALEEALQEVSA